MTKELIERLYSSDAASALTNEAARTIEALHARVAELEKANSLVRGMNQQLAEGHSSMVVERDTLQAQCAELERQNKDLDRSEAQLIQERDEREEVINALCDAVLGTDRYEWSSMYSFDDAVEEVAVKTAVLDKEVSELYALRKERDALAAELAAARAQEPVSYRYKFTHPISGEPVWRDSSLMWNGQCVQEVQPLFAAPVPPVREPLTDAEIETIARAHGTGGWQTLADMQKFARAIEAAIKEQK